MKNLLKDPLAWRSQPVRMCLVSRRNLAGPGEHYGVGLNFGGSAWESAEFQKKGGPRITSLEMFAHGLPVTIRVELLDGKGISAACQRLRAVFVNPPKYDLASRNCEHVARYIVSGKPRSAQVSAIFAVVGAFAVLTLISRGA